MQKLPIFKSVALIWCIFLSFVFTTTAFSPVVKTGVKDVYSTQPVTKIENNPNKSLLLFGASTSFVFSLGILYLILRELNDDGGDVVAENQNPQREKMLELLATLQNQQQPQQESQQESQEIVQPTQALETEVEKPQEPIKEDVVYSENVVNIGDFQKRRKVSQQDFIDDLNLDDLWN